MNNKRLDMLPALVLFARIVQYGSLTAAAQYSGLSRSAVSKQLSALEEKLATRLLQRSTRSVTLTEAGKQILDEARRIQEALDRVQTLSEELQGQVTGHLKVSCSSGIGRVHLVPVVKQFCALYPDVHVQLLLEDRLVDLIDEQIDVAIRVGHLPDSSLVALPLGQMTWVVCASPDYLNKNGRPKKPADLLQHDCLHYRNNKSAFDHWLFKGPDGEESISINGSLSINDSTALIQAAEQGQGIVWIDKNSLGDALEQGRLVQVLQNYALEEGYPIYALYPARHHLPAKTRKFVDFLAEHFSLNMLALENK
jgi:DNA-binding transcriptional LysR family regulator